jgi:hypothetical protein
LFSGPHRFAQVEPREDDVSVSIARPEKPGLAGIAVLRRFMMAKPEIEFIDCDTSYEWSPVEGDRLGIKEKILSREPETGDYTRLLKFPPGIETRETLVHDFWEEVWIVSGSLYDIAKKEKYLAGFYACRPPGMKHGPYRIPNGCVTFEIRYHKK